MMTKPPEAEISEPTRLPLKVAVLPFANQTANPDAGPIVRKMFYNFFSSMNYLDLEPSMVDSKLKRHNYYQRITSGGQTTAADLGRLLGVDALIYGEVLSLGKTYALVYADNEAGLKAKMVQCDSGQTIWELEHTVHLREGDVPLSLTGLAASIVKTAISHQQATHLKAASALCMEMIETIPNPPAVSEPPPRIQVLVHNGSGRLLRPGEVLKVALIGDKGQQARWSIPRLAEDLPMREREPGVYAGAYRIRPDDRLNDGRIVGYLKTPSGVKSQWIDTLGPLTIGEPVVLPSRISKNTVLTAMDGPYLVQRALLVPAGVRCTIEPGVVLWFDSLGIIVQGELQVLGTAQNPVQFAGIGSSTWKGVFFDHSKEDNTLKYLKIINAKFGIRSHHSQILVQNCLLKDNDWGVVLDRGKIRLSSSLVRASSKTGVSARSSEIEVRNSIITENSSGGMLLQNSSAQIEKNNISNNGKWQLKILGEADRVSAGNNWWGKTPKDADIVGPVDIQPVLKKPLDLGLFE
jgi:hypothetical protein